MSLKYCSVIIATHPPCQHGRHQGPAIPNDKLTTALRYQAYSLSTVIQRRDDASWAMQSRPWGDSAKVAKTQTSGTMTRREYRDANVVACSQANAP
jgi:hypothetical protein